MFHRGEDMKKNEIIQILGRQTKANLLPELFIMASKLKPRSDGMKEKTFLIL